MRLIDAHELVKNWYDEYIKFMTKEEIESMDGIIENAPTINAIPIPKDATNGDMIKAIFPNVEYKEGLRGDMVDGKPVNHKVVRVNGLLDYYVMDYDWWNAPYEQENEDGR